jgi:hypothetical protein
MKTRRLLDFETCSVALFASIVRHDPSLRKARATVPRPGAACTQMLPAPALGNASSADSANRTGAEVRRIHGPAAQPHQEIDLQRPV